MNRSKNKSKKNNKSSSKGKELVTVKEKTNSVKSKNDTAVIVVEKNDSNKKKLPETPVKLERSNSFVNAISNFFTTKNSSDDKKGEFKRPIMTRSRTLTDIPVRKNYRTTIRDPQLEELREECDSELKSPNEEKSFNETNEVILRSKESKEFYKNRFSENNLSFRSMGSKDELNRMSSDKIMDLLKRSFSIRSSTGKRNTINTKWSESLQNLQNIDNMVSYENLKFIDYDKFNTYERKMTQSLLKLNINGSREFLKTPNVSPNPSQLSLNIISSSNHSINKNYQIPEKKSKNSFQSETESNPSNNVIIPTTVTTVTIIPNVNIELTNNKIKCDNNNSTISNAVRRREKFKFSKTFDSTYDKNFDETKNVYRQSLDGHALKHFSKINRDSFRLSTEFDISDSLQLEKINCNTIERNKFVNLVKSDVIDAPMCIELKTNCDQINKDIIPESIEIINESKSKSLTHLDQLDQNIEIQNDQNIEEKVSSSEYFTVLFNLENDTEERKELIIPSTKGVSLANALSSALSMRNLSFSQITISDNNFPSTSELGSYTGVVDENTDVGVLAGKMLIVTEKESNLIKRSHSMLKKASSIGHTKSPKLFSSASTEEQIIEQNELAKSSSPQSLSSSLKQPKQRWSSFLGLKNPQQNQLCILLDSYAKTGVPSQNQSQIVSSPEFTEAISYLDIVINSTWNNFVNRTGMSDQETKIQSAIWELVATEADYIRALQTVSNLFLACLESVQQENLLTDVDQNKLFSNIREICDVNMQFWSLYLFPMVKHSKTSGHPLCLDYFEEGFLTFSKLFMPYTKYCAEQSTCQNTCKELSSNNILFTTYLAWCESRAECKRLRLADILVRPMQRLTKYSLLLTAIRKHLSSDQTALEKIDLMIHSVEVFVCSVDSHLTTRQENERLKGLMARIEIYDVVDSFNENLDKIVKPYHTMFDLCEPMKGSVAQSRNLFMEGDLKFKDNNSKVDVHCFLLTDIFLVCKPISKKGHALKVIRQPFVTDKLVAQLKDNVIYCVYLNDFNTAITAFTLQNPEAKVIKHWYESLIKVKHIYTRYKLGTQPEEFNYKQFSVNSESIGIRKSPHSSSIGSKVPSSNNSVSGSVELNESRNISMDYEKANSLSSDEGSNFDSTSINKRSPQGSGSRKLKITSSNSLIVQPSSSLGQSLPNLNLNSSQSSINNTLLVPGSSRSGNNSGDGNQNSSIHHSNHLLSPSHRGISYPPPSPPRGTLQRTRAIQSVKNPPLQKTKNVTSNSFSWTTQPSQTENTTTITTVQRPQQTSEPNIHHHSMESDV